VSAANEFHTHLAAGVRIAVSEWDTATTVHLEGELDLAEQQEVRDTVRDALKRRPARLILDLSRLAFIDSSGVHLLLEAAEQTAQQETSLMIVPGPPAVHRIFEICNLTGRLPFITGP
jgi:anti-anti-sigma factor